MSVNIGAFWSQRSDVNYELKLSRVQTTYFRQPVLCTHSHHASSAGDDRNESKWRLCRLLRSLIFFFVVLFHVWNFSQCSEIFLKYFTFGMSDSKLLFISSSALMDRRPCTSSFQRYVFFPHPLQKSGNISFAGLLCVKPAKCVYFKWFGLSQYLAWSWKGFRYNSSGTKKGPTKFPNSSQQSLKDQLSNWMALIHLMQQSVGTILVSLFKLDMNY